MWWKGLARFAIFVLLLPQPSHYFIPQTLPIENLIAMTKFYTNDEEEFVLSIIEIIF
jgi:hypothetical protein